MLKRNSSKNLTKNNSTSATKFNQTNYHSFTIKNNTNRLRPLQFNSPKKTIPKNKNDFYSFQKTMISALPRKKNYPKIVNLSNITTNPEKSIDPMRKTFSTKNNSQSPVQRPSSRTNLMMNTTSNGFRPPTGFRRCIE